MAKGSLSIETMIIIVMCLFVLILSILYVTNMSKPVVNSTVSTATLYSECNNWRLFGYNSDSFSQKDYPALFQTYGSACTDDKGVETGTCDANKHDMMVQTAKNFCTMEQKKVPDCSADHPICKTCKDKTPNCRLNDDGSDCICKA